MRGTFANTRIKNQMVPGVEGGVTIHYPSGEQLPIYDAAMRYAGEGVPLVVFAGKEYGTGSSRDWAAKGTRLLGVRAVIAESFERIHRSNLIGMGVLPLLFAEGMSWQTLGLKGDERVSLKGLNEIKPGQWLEADIHLCQWRDARGALAGGDRYVRRARLFPEWRHSALRVAGVWRKRRPSHSDCDLTRGVFARNLGLFPACYPT